MCIENLYIGPHNTRKPNSITCGSSNKAGVDIICKPWDVSSHVSQLKSINISNIIEGLSAAELNSCIQDWAKALSTTGFINLLIENKNNPHKDEAIKECLTNTGFDVILFERKDDGVIYIKAKKTAPHDFALNSGERQVATTIEGIRKDHINRYQLAIDILKNHYSTEKEIVGLDIFCGNGYGTYLLSQNFNAKIDAYDGSKEAIELANEHYKNKENNFVYKLFPFDVTENKYDFVVSIESIEHIKDGKLFVETISAAVKKGGILIVSAPNEEKLSIQAHDHHFHYKHYLPEELVSIFEEKGFSLLNTYGQDTHKIKNKSVILDKLPDDATNIKEGYRGQTIICSFQKR